jgi:hypothetical protein
MAVAQSILLALLGFFLLLCAQVALQRHSAGATAFVADQAYLDLAVARNLASHGFLGLGPTDPIPATSDTLWHILLVAGQKLPVQPIAVPCLLAALLGLIVLFQTRALAALSQGVQVAGPAMLLVAVTSSLTMDVLSGRSLLLTSALTALMVVRYLEGTARERWPLPLSVAWWGGLAALVHVEMLVIWLALAVHALLTGGLRPGRGRGVLFPLIRMVTGGVIIATVLTGAVAWNLHVLSIPWPRFPDAPMSLDAWATTPPGEVLAASLGLAGTALGESYARAFSVPILRGGLPLIFFALGLAFSVMEAKRDRRKLGATLSFALLLVPLFYAGLYPYVGWAASASIFSALQPVWAVAIAVGIGRSVVYLCAWVKRLARRDLPWLSSGWASAVLFSLLILSGVLRNLAIGRDEARALALTQADRQRVAEALGPSAADQVVASDRVGWLAFTRGGRFLDLSGRITPILLSFRSASGWQGAEAAAYMRAQGVTHLVLFDEAYAYAETDLGCASAVTLPRVGVVR